MACDGFYPMGDIIHTVINFTQTTSPVNKLIFSIPARILWGNRKL